MIVRFMGGMVTGVVAGGTYLAWNWTWGQTTRMVRGLNRKPTKSPESIGVDLKEVA